MTPDPWLPPPGFHPIHPRPGEWWWFKPPADNARCAVQVLRRHKDGRWIVTHEDHFGEFKVWLYQLTRMSILEQLACEAA